jgi:hypothetical protein
LSETIHFEEKEYRTLETLAKKFGFKNIDELVSTALIGFFSETYGWGIKPEDAKKFLATMNEEQSKNPDFSFGELLKKWNTQKETENVKVTLELPKPVADFIKETWSTSNLEDTLTKEIVQMCVSSIEGDFDAEPEEEMKKYGLLQIFKQYGVLPKYYNEVEAK